MHTIQILPHVQSTLDAAVRVEKDMSLLPLSTTHSEADLATKQHSFSLKH